MTTTDYPKGQNYKTVAQVKAEKAARETAAKEQKVKAEKQQARLERAENVFNTWVNNGKRVTDKLLYVLDTRPIDWFTKREGE